MYQIILRIIAPQVNVLDFAFGRIIDGQFQFEDLDLLPEDIHVLFHPSDLLGTRAYIRSSNVSALTYALLGAGASIAIYPNFVVFNLPENYVTKEEEAAE